MIGLLVAAWWLLAVAAGAVLGIAYGFPGVVVGWGAPTGALLLVSRWLEGRDS